ncbi:MAG: hypothetical protein WCF61_18510 [Terriglobales bacterium]
MEQGVATLAPGLIVAWLLVAVGVSALAVLLYSAIRSRTSPGNVEKAVQAFRSLDIGAFRNLVDRDEEAFLRDNLAPGKFRELKRQRTWAAFLYASEAGRAAAALAMVGQAAQRSSDPRIAASGAQVAESALRLRLQTIKASALLLAEFVLPDLQSRPIPSLVDQYERSSAALFRLAGFHSERASGQIPQVVDTAS